MTATLVGTPDLTHKIAIERIRPGMMVFLPGIPPMVEITAIGYLSLSNRYVFGYKSIGINEHFESLAYPAGVMVKALPIASMLVYYHGSYWGMHGIYTATPCDCNRCTALGYSDGWRLISIDRDTVLHHARTESITPY